MIKSAVFYKGVWLAPNSTAHALHAAKEFKKLEQHLQGLK